MKSRFISLSLSTSLFCAPIAANAQSLAPTDDSTCSQFLSIDAQDAVISTEYRGACLIGAQSASNYGLDFGAFEHLSDFELTGGGSGTVFGLDQTYNAVVVDDNLVHLLAQDNEVLPFIVGVVAIDAALLATGYAAVASRM